MSLLNSSQIYNIVTHKFYPINVKRRLLQSYDLIPYTTINRLQSGSQQPPPAIGTLARQAYDKVNKAASVITTYFGRYYAPKAYSKIQEPAFERIQTFRTAYRARLIANKDNVKLFLDLPTIVSPYAGDGVELQAISFAEVNNGGVYKIYLEPANTSHNEVDVYSLALGERTIKHFVEWAFKNYLRGWPYDEQAFRNQKQYEKSYHYHLLNTAKTKRFKPAPFLSYWSHEYLRDMQDFPQPPGISDFFL